MIWNRSLIGIDIGSSSIKVCELDRSGKRLKKIGLELIPQGAVEDGEIKDMGTMKDALIHMFKRMKLNVSGRRASIGIGGAGVIIKRSLFMPEGDQDIYEQASYEAAQSFPYDPDDLYVRYAQIGKSAEDGRVPLALVGAKREIVEQYISLIHSIGMKVGVVDCGIIATANMFDYNYPFSGAMVVIANIGASSTQVIITFNGDFLYARDIAIGGKEYNRRIMEGLAVDFENAENLKISASLNSSSAPPDLLKIISEVNDLISQEINTTLNFFFENEESPPGMTNQGYLFLVGGSARSLGLDAAIAATLQMPVQLTNPFHRIETKSSPYEYNYILNQGSLYGISLGLAIRKFRDDTEGSQ